jgi:lipopolysaccharide export system permease protein
MKSPSRGALMRTTLDRYVMRESAAATLAVTLVLLAIMLSARFAKFLGAVADGELPRELLTQVVALSSIQYLVLIVPASLLLAVMLTLGRFYKDSEVAGMMGCGVSLGGLYRPFLFLSMLMAAITAWLALEGGPWAGRQVDYIFKDARRLVQYTPFEPGRFKTVGNGRAVFYTEQMDAAGKDLTTVFARIEDKKGESVVIAQHGHQQIDPSNGERRVTLSDGWRYFGEPGRADFDVMRFATFETRITPPEFVYLNSRRKLAETRDLALSEDPEDAAELAWRIAAPISVLVLGLLAVPLSHLKPRQGRYSKVVLGIVLYLVYSNLMGVGQSWIAKGVVSPALGLWWVHGIFAATAVFLFGKRQGWFVR